MSFSFRLLHGRAKMGKGAYWARQRGQPDRSGSADLKPGTDRPRSCAWSARHVWIDTKMVRLANAGTTRATGPLHQVIPVTGYDPPPAALALGLKSLSLAELAGLTALRRF
jgi:hypothetical protein